MPRGALRRRFAVRSRMRGSAACRGPRNAVEMRRGAFGANTELLSLLFSMCVPFYAQPCQKVDERGYRLTYEDKQPRENLREER